MELFFEANQMREQDKVCTVMMHVKGRVFQWHQHFMKNQGNLRDVNWNHYLLEILLDSVILSLLILC